jgi:divalent metal cation (Fe/Co/Zn/Cd) transporter
MFCAVLLGAPFGFRRKRAIAILLVASAISMAGFLMACGSSPSAPRTYTVTVTPKGVATPVGAVTVTDPAPVVITVTVQ